VSAWTYEARLEAQCERALGHCSPIGLLDPHEHVLIVREDMSYTFVVRRVTFHPGMLGSLHKNVDAIGLLSQVPMSRDGRFGCIFVVGVKVTAGLTRLRPPAGDA
jgi:hypothetical protein